MARSPGYQVINPWRAIIAVGTWSPSASRWSDGRSRDDRRPVGRPGLRSATTERLDRLRALATETLRQSKNREQNALLDATRDQGDRQQATVVASQQPLDRLRREIDETLARQRNDPLAVADRARDVAVDARLDGLIREQRADQTRLADRWESLRSGLDQREAVREETRRELGRRFQQTFGADDALRALWERAAPMSVKASAEGFDQARARFWRLVNHDAAREARDVRRMIREGGYEIQAGTRAPVLRLQTPDESFHRDQAARLLSIDHVASKSRVAEDATEQRRREIFLGADNLRFLSAEDNRWKSDRIEP